MAQLKNTTIEGFLEIKEKDESGRALILPEGSKIYVGEDEFQGGGSGDVNANNPVFTGSVSMGRAENSEKGESSVALGENLNVFTKQSVGFGADNIVGQKGYYIKAIDFSNNYIWLADSLENCGVKEISGNRIPIETDKVPNDWSYNGNGIWENKNDSSIININNEDFESGYTARQEDNETGEVIPGDLFNIIVPDDHFILCGEIIEIVGNRIKYEIDTSHCSYFRFTSGKNYTYATTGDVKYEVACPCIFLTSSQLQTRWESLGLEWTTLEDALGRDDYSFSVSSKPTTGTITITRAGFVSGVENKVTGGFSRADGAENLAAGNFSFTVGQGNIAGYCGDAGGQETQAIGKESFARGLWTKAIGKHSTALNANNEAIGENSLAVGLGNSAVGKESFASGFSYGPIALSTLGLTTNTVIDDSNRDSIMNNIINEWKKSKFSLALGRASTTMGHNNLALGDYSEATGENTIASGIYAHTEGLQTIARKPRAHAEGSNTEAGDPNRNFGFSSHAEGNTTKAYGDWSHSEGRNTLAYGDSSHAEGQDSKAHSNYSHAEGYATEARGEGAHSEGFETYASGQGAHSEGYHTNASNNYSHAEGFQVTSIGNGSHAEGGSSIIYHAQSGKEAYTSWSEAKNFSAAYGQYTHTEGLDTFAKGQEAHAEGYRTLAYGDYSHAEGYEAIAYTPRAHAEGRGTEAGKPDKNDGYSSHAEGDYTKAYGDYSHSEGRNTQALGKASHAEGNDTKASGQNSHAQNKGCESQGEDSHAEGRYTIATGIAQHVQGKYNIEDTNLDTDKYGQYVHIVGWGTQATPSNIHTIDQAGKGYFKAGTSASGSDYAEYFEWEDGNPNNEDRIGLIVSLNGEKIRPATFGDDILGIISGIATVLGDNPECEWNGKFLTDDFGRTIYEETEEFEERVVGQDENGEDIIEKISLGMFKHPKINPAYDPEQEYINRAARPEWDAVGMLGKLFVRDDGLCQPNDYVTVSENGIATISFEKTNMRMLSRVNDNVIKVLKCF